MDISKPSAILCNSTSGPVVHGSTPIPPLLKKKEANLTLFLFHKDHNGCSNLLHVVQGIWFHVTAAKGVGGDAAARLHLTAVAVAVVRTSLHGNFGSRYR